MESIVIYIPDTEARHTGRLMYVLDWLLKERLQLDYNLTAKKEDAISSTYCISYGISLANCISVPDCGLIWEHSEPNASANQGIKECLPEAGQWNGLPVLFAHGPGGYTIPFDLFSAAFYLLSRYEEYFPFTPDKHGRFPAERSILHRLGYLARPIVDEWTAAFRALLEERWGIAIPAPAFTFRPTYDIDMAYSHAYKGIGRIIGAYARAMVKGDVQQINERTRVLKKKTIDPFDSFAWLRHQHEHRVGDPAYFILCALRTTPFDKNIHPRHPAMIRVIKQLAKEGEIGIHPSYFASHYDVVAKEKKVLEQVTGRSVSISRQHYIRLVIPGTYHLLIDNGITDDYSMGYGTHLGFRAGTGSSFPWYDLHKETATNIRVHPFCFMDTTAHYDQQLGVTQAFQELGKMANILKETGSTLITVFHNFSLGTAQEWHGWSEAYQQFLMEMGE